MPVRHFISLRDCSPAELRSLIRRAIQLKSSPPSDEPLRGKVLGMIFEKSSTRTRLSFEVGMAQLGGRAIFLSPRDTQLGRGETIEDSARVMSRMLDCVMLRTHAHSTVATFAAHSRVPVINGLTDRGHPCQLLADLQTFFERRGDIAGHRVAWIGDGNNVCQSYMEAAELMDFELRIASPPGYEPDLTGLAGAADGCVTLCADALTAAKDADVIVTDVWTSMGQEVEQAERLHHFQGYQVDSTVMGVASPNALFMHCLPAHREEEVTTEVLEGPQSVVWDEAENRLHAQKALLEFLLVPV